MRAKSKKIEIFSAGCPVSSDTVAMVRQIACSSSEAEVLDMHHPAVTAKAKRYGVLSVQRFVVDGHLAACCAGSDPNEAFQRVAAVGVALA